MNFTTVRVVYNPKSIIKCNSKYSEEYKLYKSKRQQIKDKVKLMQKLIKEANYKYKEQYPLEYKQAWHTIYNYSNDLRNEIEEFEKIYDMEDLTTKDVIEEECLRDN